jgi:nitrogen regulatory protein P-II 1
MMYYLVVLVLDDPDLCPHMLAAWHEAGASGITILNSAGMGPARRGIGDDMPLFPRVGDLFRSEETNHRTLFSVVENEEKVDALVQAARACVGDFEEDDTGILFVVPVSRFYGNF